MSNFFKDNFLNLYPMKAKGVEPEKIPFTNPNYIWEEKYDGDRRFLWITENKNYNTSRSKSKKTNLPVDKTDNVPHLRDLDLSKFNGTILDGEFIHPKGFEYVRKIMGSLPERAIQLQEEYGYIEYILYDLPVYLGEDISNKPLHLRKEILKNIYKSIDSKYIKLAKKIKGNEEEIKQQFAEIVKNGGEGLVGKDINSPYRLSNEKCQPCLKNWWVKVKKEFNGDFVVMDYDEPKREYDGKTDLDIWPYWENNEPVTKYYALGWIGAIKFGEYMNGELVERGSVSSGLTEHMREEITNHKENYLGKVIEIDAMERDKKSLNLRHPVFVRFRDDKDAKDCQYENQKG